MKNWLLIFLLIACGTLLFAFKKQKVAAFPITSYEPVRIIKTSSIPFFLSRDTTPTKKYTKTATWDLGFIQGKTDSLFLYFRQFGGSAMSKDDFNNALMQYIGVIQRAYLVAKIDSVLIK